MSNDIDRDADRDPSRDLWEQYAQWWVDGFTGGADAEYEDQIIPLAAHELEGYRRVLDIGCGDGQISRVLKANGAEVVGVDPTWNQITIAQQRGGGPAYARAAADRLPFSDASFDAAVACLVFEHIDAVDEAIGEIARIVKPGGRFSFFVNHPLLQTPGSGFIDDHMVDPPEQYWRVGAYLVESEGVEEVEQGVFIRFIHRPLSRYINTMLEQGFELERMLEPAPPPSFLERAPEYPGAAVIPRLMYLRMRRR